jgi:hypothetical protein
MHQGNARGIRIVHQGNARGIRRVHQGNARGIRIVHQGDARGIRIGIRIVIYTIKIFYVHLHKCGGGFMCREAHRANRRVDSPVRICKPRVMLGALG